MFALIDDSWQDEYSLEHEPLTIPAKRAVQNSQKSLQARSAPYYQLHALQTPKPRHLSLVQDDFEHGKLDSRIETRHIFEGILRHEITRNASAQELTHGFTPDVHGRIHTLLDQSTSKFSHPVSMPRVKNHDLRLREINQREIQSPQYNVTRNKRSSKKHSLWARYIILCVLGFLACFSFYHVDKQNANIAINPSLGQSIVIPHSESLAQIAHAYAPDLPQSEVIDEIMSLNNLHDDYVLAGEVIIMPNI